MYMFTIIELLFRKREIYYRSFIFIQFHFRRKRRNEHNQTMAPTGKNQANSGEEGKHSLLVNMV